VKVILEEPSSTTTRRSSAVRRPKPPAHISSKRAPPFAGSRASCAGHPPDAHYSPRPRTGQDSRRRPRSRHPCQPRRRRRRRPRSPKRPPQSSTISKPGTWDTDPSPVRMLAANYWRTRRPDRPAAANRLSPWRKGRCPSPPTM
jgi:hypothetical protein